MSRMARSDVMAMTLATIAVVTARIDTHLRKTDNFSEGRILDFGVVMEAVRLFYIKESASTPIVIAPTAKPFDGSTMVTEICP